MQNIRLPNAQGPTRLPFWARVSGGKKQNVRTRKSQGPAKAWPPKGAYGQARRTRPARPSRRSKALATKGQPRIRDHAGSSGSMTRRRLIRRGSASTTSNSGPSGVQGRLHPAQARGPDSIKTRPPSVSISSSSTLVTGQRAPNLGFEIHPAEISGLHEIAAGFFLVSKADPLPRRARLRFHQRPVRSGPRWSQARRRRHIRRSPSAI